MARSATTWRKGQCGNVRGRPNERTVVDELRAELSKVERGADGRFAGKGEARMVRRLVEMATRCSEDRVALAAIKLVMAYLAGTPRQTIEISGELNSTPTQVDMIAEADVLAADRRRERAELKAREAKAERQVADRERQVNRDRDRHVVDRERQVNRDRDRHVVDRERERKRRGQHYDGPSVVEQLKGRLNSE